MSAKIEITLKQHIIFRKWCLLNMHSTSKGASTKVNTNPTFKEVLSSRPLVFSAKIWLTP